MTEVSLEGASDVVAPEVAPESQQEKQIPQSQVNKITGQLRQEAREKIAAAKEEARREVLAELESKKQVQPEQPASSFGGMPQLSQEEIRRMAREEYLNAQREEMGKKAVDDFYNRLNVGQGKYEDFDKVVQRMNFEAMAQHNPQLLRAINSVDNLADVVKELDDNPMKLASLHQLTLINPQLAYNELNKLSDSIKKNQAALDQASPKAPLGQLKHSTSSTDNGRVTVKDIRRDPRYRA